MSFILEMPRGPKVYLKSSLRPKVDKKSEEYKLLIETAAEEILILERMRGSVLEEDKRRINHLNKRQKLSKQRNILQIKLQNLESSSKDSKLVYQNDMFFYLGEIEDNKKLANENDYPYSLPKPRNIWE